jgi:hypothetical protein
MLFGMYVHGAYGLRSLMAYLAAVFLGESIGESIVS